MSISLKGMPAEEREALINEAVQRLRSGEKWKVVQEDTGLHASPLWNAWRVTCIREDSPELFIPQDVRNTPALAAKEVVRLRDEEKVSWGEIMARFSPDSKRVASEASVRKLYKEATGIRSEGLRIGKGGRYFANEPAFYEGDLNPTGTEIPADMPVNVARVKATEIDRRTSELLAMSHRDLRGLAKSLGMKVPTAVTTPQLIRAIKLVQKAATPEAPPSTAKQQARKASRAAKAKAAEVAATADAVEAAAEQQDPTPPAEG